MVARSTGQRQSSLGVQRVMLVPPELRARRLALGLTQVALAGQLEVSANTLARWERGELRVGDPRRIARRLQRLEQHHRMQSPPAHAAPVRRGPASHAAVDAASPELNADRQILPDELTSFIGREADLFQLRRLVASARLVTLTGAGGVGKTRLALEVLRDVRAETEAMLVWTDLSPLSDPRLVPQTVRSEER